MPDRCKELVVLNQAIIDALTAAYMAKRRLEIAMRNDDTNLQAHLAALEIAQSRERQAVAARNKHKQEHCCGSLVQTAGF